MQCKREKGSHTEKNRKKEKSYKNIREKERIYERKVRDTYENTERIQTERLKFNHEVT